MSEKNWIALLFVGMGCCAFPLAQSSTTGESNTELKAYQPARLTAAIGDSVTLNCFFNYTGSPQDTRMGKFYTKANGPGMDEAENVSCKPLISKANLFACELSSTITFLRPENETVYYCDVWIPRPQGTIQVTGNGTIISLYYKATSISIQVPLPLVSGEEAILVCSVSGFYPQDLSVLWFHRGQQVSHSSISNHISRSHNGTFSLRSQYRFKATVADNMAECCCKVSHPAVGWERATSIILGVNYAPSTVNVTSHSRLVINATLLLEVGSPLDVICSADGNPSPEIHWLTGSRSVWNSRETLQLTAVQKEHHGVYWCVAKNQYGERNTSITLVVFQSEASLGNPGLIALCGLAVVSILSVLVTIGCVLKKSKNRSSAEALTGVSQHSTFSHEGLAASPDEIYSVLNISTKRSKQQNPAPQNVDTSQLVYAEIMFPFASRKKNVMAVDDSSCDSTVIYDQVNTRSSARRNSQQKSLRSGCDLDMVQEQMH
ncbi:neuronal growth regulator 1-like isoform X2 [Megalops cyprinoides]|uniref:neuronal growth regulator 1-like isoform X2 n=1 Tax=Megalops cyprinoides TaxID=118141 RepID=UPI001864CDAF|nr:neuronal growth regulator 1-like isoform X2 [Megalops cyprinoides]